MSNIALNVDAQRYIDTVINKFNKAYIICLHTEKRETNGLKSVDVIKLCF